MYPQIRNCKFCGKSIPLNKKKQHKRTYCSNKCKDKYNIIKYALNHGRYVETWKLSRNELIAYKRIKKEVEK